MCQKVEIKKEKVLKVYVENKELLLGNHECVGTLLCLLCSSHTPVLQLTDCSTLSQAPLYLTEGMKPL